jgi:hypothetical protein
MTINVKPKARHWRIWAQILRGEAKYASAKAGRFYSIYSEQTIAEASAVVENVQVCSKWSDKCRV